MSNTRYIELDSTFRDRTKYPYPAQFVVQIGVGTTDQIPGLIAVDPILDGYPYYPVPLNPPVTFAGGTNANPILDANASNISNYYIDSYLEDTTLGEFRRITSYDGATKVVTLDSPFSGGWAAGDNYQIRFTLPIQTGVLTGGSINSFTLSPSFTGTASNYVGNYIWITSGPAAGDVRRIVTYDPITHTGTVRPNFTAAPGAGDTLELLNFTTDNAKSLIYTGSMVSQSETVCYEIELINLVLPNVILQSGYGGLLAFQPYLYVELSNVSSPEPYSAGIIYSNNPNSRRALFRAPTTDISDPLVSKFIKLDGSDMVQTVKFKPNDSLRFSVFLPNGELMLTEPDFFSPLRPNPILQISAAFAIRRL